MAHKGEITHLIDRHGDPCGIVKSDDTGLPQYLFGFRYAQIPNAHGRSFLELDWRKGDQIVFELDDQRIITSIQKDPDWTRPSRPARIWSFLKSFWP